MRLSRPWRGNSPGVARSGTARATVAKNNFGRLGFIPFHYSFGCKTLISMSKLLGILPHGQFSQYSLASNQQRIPEVSVWRRVSQIELCEFVDAHSRHDCCRRHVNTL